MILKFIFRAFSVYSISDYFLCYLHVFDIVHLVALINENKCNLFSLMLLKPNNIMY